MPWTNEQRRAKEKEKRRANRLAQGLPGRDAFDNPRIRQNAIDLRAMEGLPVLEWPADLFGQYVPIKELMADGIPAIGRVAKLKPDELCFCGTCGKPHRNNVSRVIEEDTPYGYQRRVAWYYSMEHRNRHVGLVK